jgi:uncharacterized coiled-coil protein SlyX
MMKTVPFLRSVLSILCIIAAGNASLAQQSSPLELDKKITEFEKTMSAMQEQLEAMKELRQELQGEIAKDREQLAEITAKIDTLQEEKDPSSFSSFDRFTIGGYGDIHANFNDGGSGDHFDIHRLVLYLGYDFADWIQFHSETEIEHAFVSSGSGGELSLEQAYFDFLLNEYVNVRVGRILTPVGIINRKHEPPSFYGVERPNFSKYIIPTTWSSDGIGIFGSLLDELKYEAYVVAGLNGANFDSTNGIRGGRFKERPSFNDIAFTARLDYFPFMQSESAYLQTLRLGASTYAGGLDNGNSGKDPNIDGDLQIYATDFEYTIHDFDFRGELAYEKIGGAANFGANTASEIMGWYLEAGYHFWPDSFKTGKLQNSDAAVFVRFEDYDTQYDMPFGVAANPAGDRQEWTMGVNFYPTPNLVLKADYQIRDDATTQHLDNLINLGVGWQF